VIAARETGARVIVTSHAGSLGFLCERGTLMRDGEHVCDASVPTSTCASCALTQRGLSRRTAGLLGHMPEAASSLALLLPSRLGTAMGMRALVAESRRMQQRLFSAIDAFVVLSEWAARALLASGAPSDKVILNRLGVTPALTKPVRPAWSRPLVFGFVGRAEPIKGLDDAVRAVASLPGDCDVLLRVIAVASSDADRDFVLRCRQYARNDSRIRFEEPVAPDAIGPLLASMDLLLCPSRVVEGGPTIALEARAVGTPVIGTRVPALSEIVRDGIDGRLHAPGDVAALAACLREVAADPVATLETWRARLDAPRTTEAVAAKYLDLYQTRTASLAVARVG
jgi:glycosyltransferase involved in cell wall biosynthesis